MKIIVIGAGETGKAIVNMLTGEKHDVSVVESDDKIAEGTASDTDALVIKGDATDISTLKDAGIDKADAVIAATNDDKTNLMVCEIAKSSNIKKIISRVNNPKNEELFNKLGIKSIVPVVSMTVTAIRRCLSEYGERVIAQLGDGKVEVLEATIGQKSTLIDKEAKITNAIIGSIYRSGEIIVPDKRTKLKAGDVVIMFVKPENLSKVIMQTTGK